MAKRIPADIKKLYDDSPSPHRETMLQMRRRILEIIPNAEEVISYGMPAFKVDNEVVAGVLAHKQHVGFYPFSGSIIRLFPEELNKYRTTLSAIHVPIDKPLPKGLIKKLLKARINL